MKAQFHEEEKRMMNLRDLVFHNLFKERIIFVSGTIVPSYLGRPYPGAADFIVAQLLSLEGEDREAPIDMYINSPGGDVSAALAIYDAMQLIRCPVRTTCVGMAASAAALLLAAGEKGKRYALPNSRIMIHQPWGGVQGQAIDIKIEAEEIMRLRDRVNKLLAQHTGQPVEKIEQDTDRNFWMSAQEAKDYGLIDEIVASRT
jgi:ATP-dependent Clp protease protease subunit